MSKVLKKLVIFDWSGTIVDLNNLGPMIGFRKTFDQFNINVTDQEINKYMGMDKYQHLYQIIKNRDMVDQMYPKLIQNLLSSIKEHSQPVKGFNHVYRILQSQNYLIGSTSGYNRIMLNQIINNIKNQMIIPYNVTSDEVTNGRPSNEMIRKNLIHFGITENETEIIKVGDTVMDILEGVNSNAIINIGINPDPNIQKIMIDHGATHVCESLLDIVPLIIPRNG